MEEMNMELGSSLPLPLSKEQDPLPSVGPLLHHLLPPPAPAAENDGDQQVKRPLC